MKKIVLFYKRLIEPGGAERLLINEYVFFKKLGYEVNIVSFKISNDALFGEEINEKDKIELGDNWIFAMINFIKYIKVNNDLNYLCASGFIEMYLASLFTNYTYSLHIHHPSYMSFTETDKYSIFQKKHFNEMLKSNFGAQRFKDIDNNMSIFKKIYINIRSYFSINGIKKSKNNFLLSKYAQNEKKILFGIDSHVLCGALNSHIFEYFPTKDFSAYDSYKYKLLSIARLDENKRIDELIKAFKLFLEIEPKSIFFIGGRGPELENLKVLSKELNLEKNIVFLGFISENDLYDWYSMADLFISIDWADYRITMYESLVMGTKVLLSNETDGDEFLIKNRYLYLTQPDIGNTFKSIKDALREEPLISKKKLNEYLKNFTWENYCSKIIKILDNKI